MKATERIRRRLEAELRRLEDQLRRMSAGPAAEEPTGLPEPREPSGDLHDEASASQAKEMAYETRGRVLRRQAAIRDALGRLREGRYGTCRDCGDPIPEKRLLAIPETSRCIPCQDRREREGRSARRLHVGEA
jgi:DnaK suppressor protein